MPGGSFEHSSVKRSSVEHRALWLLGTSCCLMVLQEVGLAVSELQQAASPAHGPEFLAGARRGWAATLATLPGRGSTALQPLDGRLGWSPGWAPPQAAVLSSGKHRQMLSI